MVGSFLGGGAKPGGARSAPLSAPLAWPIVSRRLTWGFACVNFAVYCGNVTKWGLPQLGQVVVSRKFPAVREDGGRSPNRTFRRDSRRGTRILRACKMKKSKPFIRLVQAHDAADNIHFANVGASPGVVPLCSSLQKRCTLRLCLCADPRFVALSRQGTDFAWAKPGRQRSCRHVGPASGADGEPASQAHTGFARCCASYQPLQKRSILRLCPCADPYFVALSQQGADFARAKP